MRLLEKLCSSAAGSSAPKPAFAKVLTPNRIPEFCIPPRLPSPIQAAAVPRRCAAESDLWPPAADEDAGLTDWDPRSRIPPHWSPGPATPAAPGGPRLPQDALAPRRRRCRLLRVPDGLLSHALSRRLARVRSVSSGNEDEERRAGSQSPARSPSSSPPSSRTPLPERLEAEGTVAVGSAGDALRLAAEYCPGTGRLRLRLLRAESLAGSASGPRAVRCRLSLVLRPPGTARRQCSAVVGRSRKASLDQDFCFDGLSEDEVRRLAVRVKARDEGRGRDRGRLLGQGELSLGALLLL
uniref:C2 calcium dependent domain containing 4B n=1 Tax=Nomascus leucogenys TaxID=61853 RepID=A0A2I3HQP3_NOMLE